jgi:hypothetical protein
MLTPPWHLIPPLIYSEVRVRPFSDLYFREREREREKEREREREREML